MRLNITDRKIVDTGRADSLDGGQPFRAPEVKVVGQDFTVPPPSSDPTGVDQNAPAQSDVGVVRNITLESQDVRIQPDGSAVVDVTLSFDQADGAAKHELRLTKV
jgi:hypothetical protein